LAASLRRRPGFFGLAFAFAIVVAGCGGTAGPLPTPSFSFSPIVIPSPSVPPTATPTVIAQSGSTVYLPKRAAFIATWRYETLVQLDLQAGEARAYADGVSTCDLIRIYHSLPGNIPPALQKQSSWTGSGAEAVVSAALRALCPELGARFLSQFDKDVALAQSAIQKDSGIFPPEIATGQTAKLVCDFLSQHPDVHGLWDLMVSEGTPGNAPIKIVVREVASAHCLFIQDRLGGFWYDNSPGPPRY